MKSPFVGFKCPQEIHEILQQLKTRAGTNMSEIIILLIQKGLKDTKLPKDLEKKRKEAERIQKFTEQKQKITRDSHERYTPKNAFMRAMDLIKSEYILTGKVNMESFKRTIQQYKQLSWHCSKQNKREIKEIITKIENFDEDRLRLFLEHDIKNIQIRNVTDKVPPLRITQEGDDLE